MVPYTRSYKFRYKFGSLIFTFNSPKIIEANDGQFLLGTVLQLKSGAQFGTRISKSKSQQGHGSATLICIMYAQSVHCVTGFHGIIEVDGRKEKYGFLKKLVMDHAFYCNIVASGHYFLDHQEMYRTYTELSLNCVVISTNKSDNKQ